MLSKEEIIAVNNTELGRKPVSTVERGRQTCSRLTEPGAPDQANGASGSVRFTATLIAQSNNSITPGRQARLRLCLISSKMPDDATTFNSGYKSGQACCPPEKHLSESSEWTQ